MALRRPNASMKGTRPNETRSGDNGFALDESCADNLLTMGSVQERDVVFQEDIWHRRQWERKTNEAMEPFVIIVTISILYRGICSSIRSECNENNSRS